MKDKNLILGATRTRILDTGEYLFAKQGFYGISLRGLAQAARVNVAAINYHFGDMKALYTELLVRRLRPLNSHWLALLAEKATPPEPPAALAQLVEAMCDPLFEAYRDPDPGPRNFLRILSRCLSEPVDFAEPILVREYFSGVACFSRAIRRQVKALSPDEFMWRFSFVLGALHHTLATLPRMGALTNGICQNNDHQSAQQRFVSFAVATFAAPATANSA